MLQFSASCSSLVSSAVFSCPKSIFFSSQFFRIYQLIIFWLNLLETLIKMKLFVATVLLFAAVFAHPPVQTDKADEKPITEASADAKADEKLPVEIYYEGLCPDSRKLMADLGREYYIFRKHIKLDFVPFGKSESLDAAGDNFKCHHGPKECEANRVHSCGLEYLSSQDTKQQFVVCQMRTEADQSGKEVCKLRVQLLLLFCIWKLYRNFFW